MRLRSALALVVVACAVPHRDVVRPVAFADWRCPLGATERTCVWADRGAVACCALQADGTRASWVCPEMNQTIRRFAAKAWTVQGLVGVAQVQPGDDHLCARMLDGTVRCLGTDREGALAQGAYPHLDPIVSIGLFGAGSGGIFEVKAGVAGDRACSLFPDGAVRCRPTGAPQAGLQCRAIRSGQGVYADCTSVDPAAHCGGSPVALTVPGLRGIIALAGDSDCALLADRTVRCWGKNAGGEVGIPPSRGIRPASFGIPVPTEVPGLRGVRQVVGSCAVLESSGEVRCWGPTYVPPIDEVDELRLWPAGGCARRHGRVACWGERPTIVPELGKVRELALGSQHACALVGERVSCWGRNDEGQLGDGTTTTRATPRPVVGLAGVVRIASAGSMTCALRRDHGVWCWGALPNAKEGGPRVLPSPTPVAMPELGPATSLGAGGFAMCSVTEDTRVRCVGTELVLAARVEGGSATQAPPPGSVADGLLPDHDYVLAQLTCDGWNQFCSGEQCFATEDECLDWRAASLRPDPCRLRRQFRMTSTPAKGEAVSCTVADGSASSGCPIVDPETDQPLAGAALERACDAHLVSSQPAAPSQQRTRVCVHLEELAGFECDCPPPPPHAPPDYCHCPETRWRVYRCFRSAKECERKRAESAHQAPSATDAACTTILP